MKKNESTLIDKKAFWVFVFQIFKILNGLVAILLLPLFLTSRNQGIWFLMLSFGSIILLFSASQNNIALIFGAHEFKKLATNNLKIVGRQIDIDNLSGFIKFSSIFFLKLLTWLSLLVLISFIFYINEANSLNLILIFLIYVVGLYLYSLNFYILSYIESFNKVEYAYKFKSILIATIIVSTIYFLYSDYKLYALSLSVCITMLFWFIYFLYKFKNHIKNIVNKKNQFNKYKKIIFLNYFKKNSFSMISGFLLFQIYTPIVYSFYGARYSGKVGLSIAIMTALFAISTSALHAKLPLVAKLISEKRYQEAYHIYFNASRSSLLIFILLLLFGSYLLFNVNFFNIYQNRVVDISSFFILSAAWFFQIIIYSLVMFTRMFKRELFVIPTIVSSIYILIFTIVILKYFTVKFIFLGLLSSYLFGLPWIYIIYKDFLKGKI